MSTKYKKIQPRLTIVGTGPGDADLVTVKGVQAITSADVILYDTRVNTELLKYAPVGAKKIFIGKRSGSNAYTQEQVNALVVDLAFSHGHVVSLKAGDPFVLESGYEEASYADVFNIETEIVPGLSNSIAVAGLQRLPVVHKGISDSFWVISGTAHNDLLSADIKLAARSSATVVILSGLHKLEEIVSIYKKLGKHDLPVAIIQDGSLPTENIALGTVATIAGISREEKIGAPAIIVIGEVVKLHPLFSFTLAENKHLLN